jgi:hypothetical protein
MIALKQQETALEEQNALEQTLQEIEVMRSALIDIVNKNMDSLKQRVLSGENSAPNCGENEYRLDTPAACFKGTKPIKVTFDGETIPVRTWREVYTKILRHCVADQANRGALMSLRNRIAGRERMIVSDTPAGMNVPIMLSEELYVEAYFDTEWLIRILTHRILNPIRYDYRDITITVFDRNRGSR